MAEPARDFAKIPTLFPSTLRLIAQALGDIDGDGDLDLAVAGEDGFASASNADARSDVSVTLTRNVDQLLVDNESEIVYSLAVTNTGPGIAEDVIVSTKLPTEVTKATWTCLAEEPACSSGGTGNVMDTITLAPNATVKYEITGIFSADRTDTLLRKRGLCGLEPAARISHRATTHPSTLPTLGRSRSSRFQLSVDRPDEITISRPTGDLDPSSGALVVTHRTRSGVMTDGETMVQGNAVRLALDDSLHPGELVQVTLTNQSKTLSGDDVGPHVWEFHAPVRQALAFLVKPHNDSDGLVRPQVPV